VSIAYSLCVCVCVCVCVCMSVCILYYPARDANAPYSIVICGLSESTIFFPHYVIRQDFREKLVGIKSVFRVSQQLLSEIFLILRRIQGDIINVLHRSSWNCTLFFLDFSEN